MMARGTRTSGNSHATEDTQQDVATAVEAIQVSAALGTTAAKQDLILAALGGDLPDLWKHKFGAHLTLTGATESDIWPLGTTINCGAWFIPAGGALTAVSTEAGDTGSLTVQGILADGTASKVTVTMTGTTPVAIAGTWKCVYCMCYVTAVFGCEPIGVITALIGAVVVATILANDGQALQAFYVIPQGYTGYLVGAYCSAGGALDEMMVRVKVAAPGESWRTKHLFAIFGATVTKAWALQGSPKNGGMVLTEGTLIKMTAIPITGTRCSAGFDIALYLNT